MNSESTVKHKVSCSQGPPREEGLGGRDEPVQNNDYDNNSNGNEVAEKVTMDSQSYV